MEYLVIIRHGEFDEGETKLNETGRRQMLKLIPHLSSFDLRIYSSSGPRAIESAGIIAEVLNKKFESLEFFGSRSRGEESLSYTHALTYLATVEENTLIVTKGEWANKFIPYFCRYRLDIEVPAYSLERGSGVLIELGKKTLRVLP